MKLTVREIYCITERDPNILWNVTNLEHDTQPFTIRDEVLTFWQQILLESML